MKRLIKHNNHVSREIHEDVVEHVLDNNKSMKRNSSDSYLLAKQIVMDLPLTVTNDLLLKIMKYIDGGKYTDLGKSKENWDKWLERTSELLKEEKILLASKRLKKKSSKYNVHEIVNKLYKDIPLVPIGDLLHDISQDIQLGLFDDCGDPNTNWENWKQRAMELLKERNIINVMDDRKFISIGSK